MSLLKPISLIFLIVFLSLAVISIAISSIPFLSLPTSIELVQSQITHLRSYSQSSTTHSFHLLLVLSIIFISKQAFSIPGTALLNILIGSIYPIWLSTPLTCLLTAIGSTGAYLIAKTSRPLIVLLIPKPLQLIQRAIDPFRIHGSNNRYHTAQLSSYLLIARFLPIVPYAALNLACGVLELPLIPFFWTLLVGSVPYNLLTTQLGDILRTASDSSSPQDHHSGLTEIWSAGLLFKLASISLLAILPVLFKDSLRNVIQNLSQLRPSAAATEADKEWLSDREGRRKTTEIHSNHNKVEYSLSPIIFNQEELSDQFSRSNSESSLSSPDELVIQFTNPPPLHFEHPRSPNHYPHSLPILNDRPLHLIDPKPSFTHSSLFDLPYRKVARLASSPAHFTPFT